MNVLEKILEEIGRCMQLKCLLWDYRMNTLKRSELE